jgi:serine/threonine protein kinase
VVLYELYIGCPPYHADTKRELYEIVRKGVIRFSKNTPELFKDLIKRLMAQNPEKRLGF